MKNINSIKFSIILTNIFILVIFFFAVALPFLVTWYVETTNRLESLATTIMVTCYPCAPFTILALIYLRKFLININCEDYKDSKNVKYLSYMAICCLIISAITIVAGRFYLPFFIVAATFLFLALLIFVLRSVFLKVFTEE